MTNELLSSKIELLQEQIDNLEKSGHFTEQEINSRSIPLNALLSVYQKASELYTISKYAKKAADSIMEFTKACDQRSSVSHLNFGMTKQSYEEGDKIHNHCFDKMIKARPNYITVVAAEIITRYKQ